MKKWIWVIALLFSTVCFAGERNMIRNFDKNGLKDLNNQLKKQEKLIKKLQKQLGQSGASTTAVQSTEDFVSETVLDNAGTVINTVPAVGVAREDGRLELYDTSIDEATVINIEPSSYVHETQAKIAVPSSYFLDLRGQWKSTTTVQYTADVAILHNINGDTLTLTNLDETNSIGTAGPIAGGRDQVGAFDASSWIHFFFIYNPTTGDKSSLSSASPTAPTLPTGYTFFVRVGCTYFNVSSVMIKTYQIDNKIYIQQAAGIILRSDAPAVASVWESIDLSAFIPPSAKSMQGYMGTSQVCTARKAMAISPDSSGVWGGCTATFMANADASLWGFYNSVYYDIPISESQVAYWIASTDDEIYGLSIISFQDDL
jgi:hypothetical protein